MPSESLYRGPSEDDVKLSIASWIRDFITRETEKHGKGAQADLARRMGVSEGTISNIMSGTLKPGFKTCVRLHFGIGAALNEVMRFPHDAVARTTATHVAPRAKRRMAKG